MPLVLMEILVPVLSLADGVEFSIPPLWIGVEIGMYQSMPVLLIHRGVLFVHDFPDTASVNIS